MTTLLDHVPDTTQGNRRQCPICQSRRALSVDADEGETGVWHCFSCEAGGDGISYLMRVEGYGFQEACKELGAEHKLEDETQYERIQRKRRRTEAEKREAEIEKIQRRLVEIERLKTYMTPKERARFGVFCTTSHLRDETQEYAAAEREKILHAAYQRHLDDYESEPTYVDQ